MPTFCNLWSPTILLHQKIFHLFSGIGWFDSINRIECWGRSVVYRRHRHHLPYPCTSSTDSQDIWQSSSTSHIKVSNLYTHYSSRLFLCSFEKGKLAKCAKNFHFVTFYVPVQNKSLNSSISPPSFPSGYCTGSAKTKIWYMMT